MSLEANLLPVTHAAGGTNLRRMEMEPVSRHVGNHILKTNNKDSYGIFITTYLHANVLSDFKCRKHVPYADSQTFDHYIPGMKITPLDTNDLKAIIRNGENYGSLYKRFEHAFKEEEAYQNPKEWYDQLVKLP